MCSIVLRFAESYTDSQMSLYDELALPLNFNLQHYRHGKAPLRDGFLSQRTFPPFRNGARPQETQLRLVRLKPLLTCCSARNRVRLIPRSGLVQIVLCEVRIYVRSAMVERRVLLGRGATAATQGAPSVGLRPDYGHILNPSFSRDSRLQSGSPHLSAAHN